MIRKYLQKIYLALIFILLYAPIVTLVVLSFNQSKTRAKWGGFTLKWYKELFQNEQIMSAFYTTLIIAFVSAAIATIIGTAAAIAIQGMKQKWKTMYMGLTIVIFLPATLIKKERPFFLEVFRHTGHSEHLLFTAELPICSRNAETPKT